MVTEFLCTLLMADNHTTKKKCPMKRRTLVSVEYCEGKNPSDFLEIKSYEEIMTDGKPKVISELRVMSFFDEYPVVEDSTLEIIWAIRDRSRKNV